MALDDLGLIPTVKKYLQTFQERTDIPIRFIHMGKEKRLPKQIEIAIFRLIQEAVQNASDHAKANEVQVKIEINDGKVIIVIKDDGIGFDPLVKKDDSFGLIGMKERVNMLKGKLTIRSTEGAGTVIIIELPLHEMVRLR